MGFYIFFMMTFWVQGQNPQILDPLPGSYVTGETTLQVTCLDPQKITRTQIQANDEIIYDSTEWTTQVQIDLGEGIRAWRFVLIVWDDEGRHFQSGTTLTRDLRVDYEETTRLILVPTVVKDRKGRHIPSLQQRHFQVLEDGKKCDIRLLEREKVPLRISLLVDTSSSLRQEVGILKKSVIQFIDQLQKTDKSSLITFNNQPQVVFGFGAPHQEIQSKIESITPKGSTALFDGLLLATKELKRHSGSRRTIVLFTDGRDSIYEEVSEKRRMLKRIIKEAQAHEIAVFAIGLGEDIHKEALEFIATETGGRFLHAKKSGDLQAKFNEVLSDLKNQYVLHVEPHDESKGAHSLDVKVKKRGARVHARRGFVIE